MFTPIKCRLYLRRMPALNSSPGWRDSPQKCYELLPVVCCLSSTEQSTAMPSSIPLPPFKGGKPRQFKCSQNRNRKGSKIKTERTFVSCQLLWNEQTATTAPTAATATTAATTATTTAAKTTATFELKVGKVLAQSSRFSILSSELLVLSSRALKIEKRVTPKSVGSLPFGGLSAGNRKNSLCLLGDGLLVSQSTVTSS